MGGQWEHLCIQLIGDLEIPRCYDCTFDFSQVLSQGGKNVVVLPGKKEEKNTWHRYTERGNIKGPARKVGGSGRVKVWGMRDHCGRGLSPFGFVLCKK